MNQEIKATKKNLFSETVYHDTPILRVASSLNRREPQEYRLMRKLGATYDRGMHTESRIFYEQARFMENFTDDYGESAVFRSFFPTYRSMSIEQQRTYFTWRSRLRAGELKRTDISYVFVYCFELLNLVGADSPEAAFCQLHDFYLAYRALDDSLSRFAPLWLKDFVVYNGLPRSLLDDVLDLTFENMLALLQSPEAVPDEALFEAMQALSSFRPENSRFYKEHPQAFQTVSVAVYRSLCAYYAEHRKTSYCESLFGRLRSQPYAMFSSAVFYDRRRFEERNYDFGPMHSYRCENGRWICRRLPAGGEKSKALGAFFRNLDSFLREAFDYPFETKPTDYTKLFAAVAKKEIMAYIEKKKASERRVVTIDYSVLDRIRAASEATREKILTDEERDDPAVSTIEEESGTMPQTPAPTAAESLSAEESAVSLIPEEREFLSILFEGGDPSAFCRSHGLMASVLADGINEKLFDFFADTVIDFSSDAPEIVADYEEDLKAMLADG